MAARFTLKLRGLTAASATIATKDIVVHDDGFLRFTDANSVKRAIPITGDFAVLVKECLTGTGGMESTDRVSNLPVLTEDGSGGRADN